MSVLVTGANGFIGRRLCSRLELLGWEVCQAHRSSEEMLLLHPSQKSIFLGDIGPSTDWKRALNGVDYVVHLAARVHVMKHDNADALGEFRRVNVAGTSNLSRQAAVAGVKRFVFLSSAKVNGESTEVGKPFTADDVPAPEDSYALSKYEAEQTLRKTAEETGMEVVIIRSPLVYGAGVKANFASMMGWLVRGVPLPLAAVTDNRRSLIALDNLVDLIVTCLEHPAAANQTFLASDGEDVSTADLIRRVGAALGYPVRLFGVPPSLLRLAGTLMNKSSVYRRLCGSLQLDITKTRKLLGWTPPISVDEGLRRTAKGFQR